MSQDVARQLYFEVEPDVFVPASCETCVYYFPTRPPVAEPVFHGGLLRRLAQAAFTPDGCPGEGECRFNPPFLVTPYGGMGSYTRWPTTRSTDSCGQHTLAGQPRR